MRLFIVLVALVSGCMPTSSTGDDGPVNAPAVCDPYCELRLQCEEGADPQDDEMFESCREGCLQAFNVAAAVDKQVCPMLLENVFACVGELAACGDYDAWLAEKSPYPCEMQETEYQLNCG